MSVFLKDLCLKTIVDNFPRYNLAFTLIEDVRMKRNLEFLQRTYSLEIITGLFTGRKYLKIYVDFLINKYLKTLYTFWFEGCSWEQVALKIAEIGCDIEEIHFQDVYFKEFNGQPPWQNIICHLSNLQSFTYQGDCHDGVLKNVGRFCPNIEEIDLRKSRVRLQGVKDLCTSENGEARCKRLVRIRTAHSNITEEGIEYFLKNVPSLEMIDYQDLPRVLYSLHGSGLSSLDDISYNIKLLKFISCVHDPYFADILKVSLSVCPHLKYLVYGFVDEDGLDIFPFLSELEILKLKHLDFSISNNSNVSRLLKSTGEKLTSLIIEKCTVSVSAIAENCPSVKELVLDEVRLLFDDDSKCVFNSLSSCTFSNINLSHYAASINLLLSSSTKLESLSFKKCRRLSFDIASYVIKYCELHRMNKISFLGSKIKKEYVKDILLNCHTLCSLDITGSVNIHDENELLKLAKILCNKVEIITREKNYILQEYLNAKYRIYNEYAECALNILFPDDYDEDFDYVAYAKSVVCF